MKKKVLKLVVLLVFVAAIAALLVATACNKDPKPGEVLDEARAAGRTPASFPAADEDYFREMDGGIPLTPNEVRGRNMWIVWTGGNGEVEKFERLASEINPHHRGFHVHR